MRQRLLLSGLLLLSSLSPAVSQSPSSQSATASQTLRLTWEWEGARSDAPTWQLLQVATSTRQTQQTTLTVTAASDSQCQQWVTAAGQTYNSATTWCGTVACPGPGAYNLQLRADQDSPSTDVNDMLRFGIGQGSGCPVVSYESALNAQSQTTTPTSTTTETTEETSITPYNPNCFTGNASSDCTSQTTQTTTSQTTDTTPPTSTTETTTTQPTSTTDTTSPTSTTETTSETTNTSTTLSTARATFFEQLLNLFKAFLALEDAYQQELQTIRNDHSTSMTQASRQRSRRKRRQAEQQATQTRDQQLSASYTKALDNFNQLVSQYTALLSQPTTTTAQH